MQAKDAVDPPIIVTKSDEAFESKPEGIREMLRLWQEQHDTALADTSGQPPPSTPSDTQNLFTQSREDESFTTIAQDDDVEDDDTLDFGSEESNMDTFAHPAFLRRGDLVELMWVLRQDSGRQSKLTITGRPRNQSWPSLFETLPVSASFIHNEVNGSTDKQGMHGGQFRGSWIQMI